MISQLERAGLHTPVALLPSSMEVKSLESFMPNASHYRVWFQTTSIDDFIDYCKEFDRPGAHCFVSAPDMDAQACFDMGTVGYPGHQKHKASMSMSKTSAYQAMLRTSAQQLTQKQAAEFLEDWSDNIQVISAEGESLTAKAAASNLLDLTIAAAKQVNSQVNDFGAAASTMESIEAKYRDQLPAYIYFACCPYAGLKERSFTLRVSILTTEQKPKIVLRIIKHESIIDEMAEEFKAKLVTAFKKLEMKTYIGSAR